MPGMDGISCLRAIREAGVRVPVVILSAHALAEERDRALGAGADAYRTKPIDFDGLFGLCRHLTDPGAAPGAAA